MALMTFLQRDATSMDLKQFQWKHRLLLIFAMDENDPHFKKLKDEIIAQKAEVENRDLLVFEIFERGLSRINTTPLDPVNVHSIRKHYAVPQSAFKVILIGKDGGIKLKQDDTANLKAIFKRVDSMPMRKNEILMGK
jgi:hypothetical protein